MSSAVVCLESSSIERRDSLQYVIRGWLKEKAGLSGSEGTKRLYERYMDSFRASLQARGLDLDSPASFVRPLAEEWASTGGRDERGVSGATYNNRLSIIASFYTYANRHDLPWAATNPVKNTPMRKVQPYRAARALDSESVARSLRSINTNTLGGLRDYALISLALVTGRRVRELSMLEQKDIQVVGDRVTVTFQRTKGGKEMRDTLPRSVGKALVKYLDAMREVYDVPHVWVCLSRYQSGHQLSYNALRDICFHYLDTTKFHTLRHTFAHAMEQSGAKVSDIQSRLGHTNIATTGRYLQSLRADENPHADDLAQLFGLN